MTLGSIESTQSVDNMSLAAGNTLPVAGNTLHAARNTIEGDGELALELLEVLFGRGSRVGWEADHDWFAQHLGECLWAQQNPEAIWNPKIVTFSGCMRSFNELIDGFLRPVFGEGYHHFGAPEMGGKSDAWFFSRPIHIFSSMPKAGARGRNNIETYLRSYLNRLEVLIHKNRKTQARRIRPRQLLFASFESEKAARDYFKPIVTDLPLGEAWKHIELPKFHQSDTLKRATNRDSKIMANSVAIKNHYIEFALSRL